MESRFFGTEFGNITREWEVKQNDKGVIYYVNNTKQTTSWNHPYFNKILEDLVMYRNIKYAAYRTSLKLRYLQSHIGLNWIKLTAVKETFAESTELIDTRLSYSEAVSLIQNALHISDEHQTEEDIRTAADLILNLMMNLYDVDRCGKIGTRSLRNALITMCCCRLAEKYQYFFTSVRDEDQNVSKEKLFFFLDDLIQIPYAIKEGESFGRNVAGTVDSCFKAGDSLGGKVNIEIFYRWLTQEPQTLLWLPTLHRVLATETVEHNVRCNVCGSLRITGLRYRCLQCVKYELCQSCFLQGQTSLSHKLKHPVREYCLPTSIKDNTKALLEILKNKFRRRHRRQTTAYLPVKSLTEDGALINWQPSSIHNSIASVSDSVDSGLAIGTDPQDADIEEPKVKRVSQSAEILGEPCSTSSPFMRGSHQKLVMLPRRDIEIQQQQMKNQIEQLKRENRILQGKLSLIYKYCDAELTHETSAIDTYRPGTSFDSLSQDRSKETLDISVSPIVNNSITSSNSLIKRQFAVENEHSSRVHQHYIDLHHIIGILTPVRHTNLTSQTSYSSIDQNGLSTAGQNDSSVPDGLEYRSADMSLPLDSTEDKRGGKTSGFHVCGVGLVESVSSSGLVDTLSDTTLGDPAKPDQNFSETESYLQAPNEAQFTRASFNQTESGSSNSSKFIASNIVNTKLHLRKTNETRQQPHLYYSSRNVKSRPAVNSSAADQSDLSCNSESFNSNVTNDDQNPLADKSYTRDDDCMSEVLHESDPRDDDCMREVLHEISENYQTHKHSSNPALFPAMYTLKQKMMGQVLMSTPVSNSEHAATRNFLRKQFRTMSLPWTSDADKENVTDTSIKHKSKDSRSISSIDMSHVSATSSHRTSVGHKTKQSPSIINIDMSHLSATSSHRTSVRHKTKQSPSIINNDMSHLSMTSSHRTSVRHKSKKSQSISSIDMSHLSATSSHRQGTLTSVDSLPSNGSLNSNDVTQNESSTGSLSNLFRKAGHIWDIVSDNMPGTGMTNGDVLENKMADFKEECATDDSLYCDLFDSPRTMDNGSILKAVNNIGNAMANFVHATEQCQQELV